MVNKVIGTVNLVGGGYVVILVYCKTRKKQDMIAVVSVKPGKNQRHYSICYCKTGGEKNKNKNLKNDNICYRKTVKDKKHDSKSYFGFASQGLTMHSAFLIE